MTKLKYYVANKERAHLKNEEDWTDLDLKFVVADEMTEFQIEQVWRRGIVFNVFSQLFVFAHQIFLSDVSLSAVINC